MTHTARGLLIMDDDGHSIGTAFGDHGTGRAIRNAQLWAAAEDLALSVKELIWHAKADYHTAIRNDQDEDAERIWAKVKRARAALAKAGLPDPLDPRLVK